MVCCPNLVSAHVCPLLKLRTKLNLVPLERLKCKTGGAEGSDSNSSTGGCNFFCMDLVSVNLPLIPHLSFKMLINI